MFSLNIELLLFCGFPNKIISLNDKTQNWMSYILSIFQGTYLIVFIYLFIKFGLTFWLLLSLPHFCLVALLFLLIPIFYQGLSSTFLLSQSSCKTLSQNESHYQSLKVGLLISPQIPTHQLITINYLPLILYWCVCWSIHIHTFPNNFKFPPWS